MRWGRILRILNVTPISGYSLEHCEDMLRENPSECGCFYGLIERWKRGVNRPRLNPRKSPDEISAIRRRVALANWAKRAPGNRNEKWARSGQRP